MNFIFLILIFCYCAVSQKIPSYVHLCRKNDPKVEQCLINTINEIMPHLVEGIPEINLPPIDHLDFSSVTITTGNTGSVNLNIELFNGTVSGLQNVKIENLEIDLDKITFSSILIIPHVRIGSTFRINGKIMLFELNGVGHANFNASDLRADAIWLGSIYKKKDKNHISIDNIELNNVQLENIRLRLDNLFGKNNEALTNAVNKVINDNAENLQEELGPIFKETIGEILRSYFNRLFSMDQLYLED